MFGTWKYDPETDEVQNLRRAYDPITARSSQHQACNRCHEKKLKCSGEKDGCERCLANELQCEYTRSRSRSSRRGKKPRTSSGGDGREASPTSVSASHSRAPSSRSKRPSALQGMAHASASASASTRAATSAEDDEGMLGRLDFSMLTPEDGFDLGLLGAGSEPAQPLSAGGASGYVVSGAPEMQTLAYQQPQMSPYAGYQQWPEAGYAPSAAPMYSPYAHAPPVTTTAGQHYPTQSYDYDYEQLDPRLWTPDQR